MDKNKSLAFSAFILGAFLVGSLWFGFEQKNNIERSSSDTSGNIFQVASSTGDTYFTVTSDGKVGIDNQAPTATLDVYGMMRVYTTEQSECTTAIEGAIQYDAYYKHFLGCNGEVWVRLDK